MIIVGGELTLENTDLVWSEYSRFYEAPFQMKSNGGTLIIDELGRQRVSSRDLLNRWIMPLEKRVDFLTLHSGKKIEVPFEQLVVFSTNLDEKEFIDEAFLRRMGYRARLELPTPGAYGEIFRRAAASRGLAVDHASVSYLLHKYGQEGRPMKCCEPRDLLESDFRYLFVRGPPAATFAGIDRHGLGKLLRHCACLWVVPGMPRERRQSLSNWQFRLDVK